MRTIRSIMTIGLVAISLGTPVLAQDAAAPAAGKNEALLRQSIEAAARGDCPAEIMSQQLHDVCLQQMPALGENIKAMGAIQSIAFLGMKAPDPNMPPVESYRVTFANGSANWMINTDPNGDIGFLWVGS